MSAEQHPLHKRYTLWWIPSSNRIEQGNYADMLTPLCTVGTIEEFWQMYSFLVRADELEPDTTYNIFEEGVKPIWEDSNHSDGGRLMIPTPTKQFAAYVWEKLLIALMGNNFRVEMNGEIVDVTDEITGIVLKSCKDFCNFAIWTKHSKDPATIKMLTCVVIRLLNLPEETDLKFRPHSNFRGHHEGQRRDKGHGGNSDYKRRQGNDEDRRRERNADQSRKDGHQGQTEQTQKTFYQPKPKSEGQTQGQGKQNITNDFLHSLQKGGQKERTKDERPKKGQPKNQGKGKNMFTYVPSAQKAENP
ncbi:putative Eukaryotic translation initiation factor 4E [Blattamonas nauphoetae]|uniref:Eukaryotic translation initiation factor 4E n=1 Tax=Blattamonas nauphoetae TaxID=2049346 RepID=A0ABQ9XFI4_9EUKA|nr:putative Eukaryotic translation initiation factor 4E [Blattamonas nauphoetae]